MLLRSRGPRSGKPCRNAGKVVPCATMPMHLAEMSWMSGKGFLTPHKGVDLTAYSSGILRKQGEILQTATTFRFDGSDLMPGAIGAGSFWSQMVFYVSGASAQKAADNIQNSWDAIK